MPTSETDLRPGRGRSAALALLLFAGPAGCGDAPQAPAGAEEPRASAPGTERPAPARKIGPVLRFEESEHDFGTVSDTDTLEHAFRFENAGDELLVVGDIKPSCGCTTITLENSRFAPGEGEPLGVVWDPKGRGRQRKTIAVASNSVTGERTVVSVSATIVPFVAVDPLALGFGRVRMGTQSVQRARLICADPELEVLEVSSQSRYYVGQVVPDPESGGLVLEVMLRPDAPWGGVFGTTYVKVRGRPDPSGEPVEHVFEVSCSAQVFGEIEASPTFFAVGAVPPGGTFRYEVVLQRDSAEPFRVLEANVLDAQPEAMRVRVEALEPAAGNGYRLILEGEAGDHMGPIRGRVLYATDVPGEEQRSLGVMGLVREMTRGGK